MTQRIIELPNSGQTRIQTALEQAVEDIRSAGPCLGAGIMLVTDGISRLSQNPLTHEKLHTFLLGDVFEKVETPGTVSTLREWSATFRRIWKNRFPEILAPTLADCRAAALELERVLLESKEGDCRSEAARLHRAIENMKYLLREYKRSLAKGTPAPQELRGLEQQLVEAEQLAARMTETTPSGSETGPRPSGRAPGGNSHVETSPGDVLADGVGLWEHLRRLVAAILHRLGVRG